MSDFAAYLGGQAQAAVGGILANVGAIVGSVWYLAVVFLGLALLLGFLKRSTGG
jgi:preprotein translocase subunit SecG